MTRFSLVGTLMLALASLSLSAQVSIHDGSGTPPHGSSMLDVQGAGFGLLAPRMTQAQRPGSPATGLLIYQTDSDPGFYYYNGSSWVRLFTGTNTNVTGVTASNGLTSSGGATPDITLGGSLSGNTTVNVGSNELQFTGGQSKIAIGEGADIEAGGNRSVAIGTQARVNGTESVAIGVGNTGTSTVTRSGDYSLAMGQNLTATGGSNGNPVIAIGSDFTNNTANSIMIGNGSSVPSITALGGSGSTPGNVGVGNGSPEAPLHVGSGNLSTRVGFWSAADTDIDGLLPGSTFGSLIEGGNNGHIVLGIRDNDVNDAFSIISGNGDFMSDDTYDKTVLFARGDGRVGVGTSTPTQTFDVDGDARLRGSRLYTDGSSSTYGGITVQGENGSWGGLNFRRANGANLGTFMMNESISGVYNDSDNGWDWYFQNGTLTVGSVPDARLEAQIDRTRFIASGDMRAPIFYDQNNTGFYLDPNGTSILNDVRGSIFYDRDNTSYFVNPAGLSEMNSISYGAASGGGAGTVRLHDGDNNIWFDWTGSQFRMWVDVTLVKTFIIDHPVVPEEKYLIHATLEGPENGVYYRGTDTLSNGEASVMLPDYFDALTQDGSATVILTPRGRTPFLLSYDDFSGNRFKVYADCDNCAFDWEVKANRQDAPDLFVEPDKSDVMVQGQGPYKYYNVLKPSTASTK